MTAAIVIEQIMRLPRDEQALVLKFAFELARRRQLSGKDLAALAQDVIDSNDPAKVERLNSQITQGFYGE